MTHTPPPPSALISGRRAAYVDMALGVVVLAAFSSLWISGTRAGAEEIAREGFNVDSGAYEMMVGILFVLPVALMLFGAAVGLWLKRAWARAVHVVAVSLTAILFVAWVTAYIAYY